MCFNYITRILINQFNRSIGGSTKRLISTRIIVCIITGIEFCQIPDTKGIEVTFFSLVTSRNCLRVHRCSVRICHVWISSDFISYSCYNINRCYIMVCQCTTVTTTTTCCQSTSIRQISCCTVKYCTTIFSCCPIYCRNISSTK